MLKRSRGGSGTVLFGGRPPNACAAYPVSLKRGARRARQLERRQEDDLPGAIKTARGPVDTWKEGTLDL
jgi:hypothetical protein